MKQRTKWPTALAFAAAAAVAGAAWAQTAQGSGTRSDPSPANQNRTGEAVPKDAAGSAASAPTGAKPMRRSSETDNRANKQSNSGGTRSDPSPANRARTGEAVPKDGAGSAASAPSGTGTKPMRRSSEADKQPSGGTRSDPSPANRARTGEAVPKDAAGSASAPAK